MTVGVCLCGDSSTDFTSCWSEWCRQGVGERILCFTTCFFLFFFSFPLTLSGPRIMVFMSNMSSQLTSGWWCRLSLFRELEVTWWSNESDTSCSLLCSAIVTKPICIKSFVHFSIDPEAVILKYISLGITQLMQTFQKRKMSQLCGFFFFLFYAVTSLVSLSLHVTLFSGESEIKS